MDGSDGYLRNAVPDAMMAGDIGLGPKISDSPQLRPAKIRLRRYSTVYCVELSVSFWLLQGGTIPL
jgi:hypothetical protein